jgi:hypothetical protein
MRPAKRKKEGEIESKQTRLLINLKILSIFVCGPKTILSRDCPKHMQHNSPKGYANTTLRKQYSAGIGSS